ncbi:hypothetical protein B0I26_12534 [Anoxybacillus vitaminiphilus]|uniref:Uncharacterized protein n=1 Tax=Paranoxybacillus vitaminiphilus TaxID=581036 RepID=A0A327Y9F0_9BACL|nr:hypothetical protein [Anoxybacillus vitaminiphilus]RAK15099.1 hypothetical protein B0I26_12534 [Anoxybacillus vitaminiphilus]
MHKQVNFRFEQKIVDMLEELVNYYSHGDYKKYSKTAIMQSLIYKDYQEKMANKQNTDKNFNFIEEHASGEYIGLLAPPEMDTMKKTYKNENLSEKAKFILYAMLMGMVLQRCVDWNHKIYPDKRIYWTFRVDSLFHWFKDIFTKEEMMDAYKELQNQGLIYGVDDLLQQIKDDAR